ncbi:MAG: hypothetical protein AAF649_04700, partial [Verrucomicrobiota bacterium]
PSFKPSLRLALDVSPWALTFYTLTLICSTLNTVWNKLAQNSVDVISILVVAAAVLVYASFMVIWRHNPDFTPGASVYIVTIILLVSSVYLCHKGYCNSESA